MAIDLKKYEQQKEDIKIDLKKKGIDKPPIIRLGATFDLSGSTREAFRAGHYEIMTERVTAVAGVLDDNGQMEMFGYSDEAARFKDAEINNYGKYVHDNILSDRHGLDMWHGTFFHEGMSLVLEHYFGDGVDAPEEEVAASTHGLMGRLKGFFGKKEETAAEESNEGDPNAPVFMMFLTDGEDSSPAATDRVLAASQNKPILWVMIGVDLNGSGRSALRDLDRKWPNVTFVDVPLTGISDAELYDKLFTDKAVKFLLKASKASHAGA
ncbi:MAG TPA: VWA domain-containing protein [Dongiaceae bacterium]|nr:VWA domain-containing protein [Dongiaceae bacterium]